MVLLLRTVLVLLRSCEVNRPLTAGAWDAGRRTPAFKAGGFSRTAPLIGAL